MSESYTWSERDDQPDAPDAQTLAEQMRAATRSLRAHLSLVREAPDEGPSATG